MENFKSTFEGILSPSVKRWATSLPIILLIAAIVLVWRRPGEMSHPYIWVEDGTVTLPAYLAHGWRSLFEPVAGYILIPAKAIFLSAMSLSAMRFSRIAYELTLVFELATIALIALSPSHLRYKRLAALGIMLIPTHPEVFAISEYAFWWGALWSFVAVFLKRPGFHGGSCL